MVVKRLMIADAPVAKGLTVWGRVADTDISCGRFGERRLSLVHVVGGRLITVGQIIK
jgi:hypothetical protein